MIKRLATFCLLPALGAVTAVHAQPGTKTATLDAYIAPYVRTNNFAGAVRVERNGRVLFERAYGFADREHRRPNTVATSFHVASVSMQFTAAAVMRLGDTGSLHLDDSVGGLVPGTAGAERITIRNLLTQRSGMPDINDLPDYTDVLKHHQTPASLVAKVSGQPLTVTPGSKPPHEEHSAYNLLALIVERTTGLPFAAAVGRLVFQRLNLGGSFIDDDSTVTAHDMARGYAPSGQTALEPADAIHWSGKSEFVDRRYWEPVRIERDSAGRPAALVYDRFTGSAVAPVAGRP